jgi:hypothetical protein
MNANKSQPNCQIRDVHYVAEGPQESVPLGKSIRLLVRKILGPRKVRMIKYLANDFLNWYAKLRGQSTKPPESVVHNSMMSLKSGDQVRVRPKEEIVKTLNHWGLLKVVASHLRWCNIATPPRGY